MAKGEVAPSQAMTSVGGGVSESTGSQYQHSECGELEEKLSRTGDEAVSAIDERYEG